MGGRDAPGEPEQRPAGPDAIHAPWRLPYLERLGAPAGEARAGGAAQPSFFVRYWRQPERDEANLVVARAEGGMILLNRYPYANGHLLTALAEPRATLLEYDADQRARFWRLVDLACALMQRTLEPQGINIGVNQGQAAGAGVPGHLHAHLVPRWHGDVNFLAVVGQVRVIPAALEEMARRYRATWASMSAEGR